MRIKISEDVSREYYETVKDILENKDFIKLRLYTQHNTTNRLLHSLNVSYLAWLMAKKLRCDAAAAARAGLLHDFCLYDFKDGTPNGEFQAFYHPKAAAENSEERFELSEKEKNAILSHMFPLGPIPKSKEAWIISTADKVCASAELCSIAIALAKRGRVEISPAV